MRAVRALTAFSLCALTSAAIALPASAQSAVLLRYHFKTNQKSSYQLALNLSGSIPVLAPKLSLAEQVPFTQKVTAVYGDGSGQVHYAFSSATTTMNGQTSVTPLTASSVERISPTGKATVVQSLGLHNQFGGVLNVDPTIGSPVFPTAPVPVGGSWTAKQHIVLGTMGSLGGSLKYTLVAVNQVKGHAVATIKATGTLPLNLAQGTTQASGTAAGSETITFDITSGSLVSTKATLKVNATLGDASGAQAGPPATLTLKLNLDRR